MDEFGDLRQLFLGRGSRQRHGRSEPEEGEESKSSLQRGEHPVVAVRALLVPAGLAGQGLSAWLLGTAPFL